MVKQWYYQNAPNVLVKNQNLLKTKKQKAQLLSNLGLRIPLSRVPLFGDMFSM